MLLAKGGGASQRWRDSALYPAFRPTAKIYRFWLRGKARMGLGRVNRSSASCWAIGEFIADHVPQARSATVLIGTPGPVQKITVELRDVGGVIVGYVKLAATERAKWRLAREQRLLAMLPSGIGPAVLKSGAVDGIEALLLTPICGNPVAARLPPPPGVMAFTRLLPSTPAVRLAEHPWVMQVEHTAEAAALDDALDILDDRSWPVVLQHGDLTPWNLRRTPTGTIAAFDWEYGVTEGLPHLDLCHFMLQVQALIYRQPAALAAADVAIWLVHGTSIGLTRPTGRAFVQLAAFDAWHKAREDGIPDGTTLQLWRRAVWRGAW